MWPELQLYIVFLLGVAVGVAAFGLYIHQRLKSWKVVKHVLATFPTEAPATASVMISALASVFLGLALVGLIYKTGKALKNRG